MMTYMYSTLIVLLICQSVNSSISTNDCPKQKGINGIILYVSKGYISSPKAFGAARFYNDEEEKKRCLILGFGF